MEKRNEILELSFEFALAIIQFCEVSDAEKKFVISRQLLKSGTSIGANIRESQNAHSRNDFISKCVIGYPNPGELLLGVLSIKKLLSKIISSTKNNRKNEK